MATQSRVGVSENPRAFAAGQEATRQAVADLSGTPHLVLVFGTTGYGQDELLAGVRAEAGSARVIGCSGEGVIGHDQSLEQERAVSVMAIRSDTLYFDVFLRPGYSSDPVGCGKELGDRLSTIDDLFGVWLLPDGLHGDCTGFLAALESSLGRTVPIAGGTAGDANRFQESYQYLDDTVATDAVCAVALRGHGRMDVAVSHGCLPIGRPRVVTRAEAGWVHEIDGQPAWSVFREYLDGNPEDLNAEGIAQLCLGERLDPAMAGDYGPYVIRTPLELNQDTGALFFPGGGLRSGQPIQLTRRDPIRIEESARGCAAAVAARHPDEAPVFVLQFDCAGRGRALFGSDAASRIIRPLQETLGTTIPWVGFHTFGEIAPIAGRAFLHNYTVALCAIYEERAGGGRP